MKAFFLIALLILLQLNGIHGQENGKEDDEKFVEQLDFNELSATLAKAQLKEFTNENVPKANEFVNAHLVGANKQPCLFSSVNSSSTFIQSNSMLWTENAYRNELLNLVVYGKLIELVRDERPTSEQRISKLKTKTNLRKFLKQFNEYTSETSMEFPMPIDTRLLLSLPSQLNDPALSDKFESLVNYLFSFHIFDSNSDF